MKLVEKIQSLLTAANTATGETDTTLTAAIGHLIGGYGRGGSGDGVETVTIPSTRVLYTKTNIDAYLSSLINDFTSVMAIVTTSINTYVSDRCCCYFTDSMIAGGSVGFTMESAATYRIRLYSTASSACKFVSGDTYVIVRKPSVF